jgi:Ca2+-binding RTX toxin-like protein
MLDTIMNLFAVGTRPTRRPKVRRGGASLVLECLEDRAVPTAGITFDGSCTVTLEGTDAAETFTATGVQGSYTFQIIDKATLKVLFTRTLAVYDVHQIKMIGNGGADDMTFSANINPQKASGSVVDQPLIADGGAGNDVITNNTQLALTASGGDGDDVITGNSGADVVSGDGGNDRIFGMGGNDTLSGGSGSDVLSGGDGDDKLDGGDDRDLLLGGNGADELKGGRGEDLLIGGTIKFTGTELAAVNAIMATWTGTADFVTRMGTLTNATTGALASTNIGNDGFNDKLTGRASSLDLDRDGLWGATATAGGVVADTFSLVRIGTDYVNGAPAK